MTVQGLYTEAPGAIVIAEDVTSSLSAELHDFSMQHILPRIGVISSSAAISFEEG